MRRIIQRVKLRIPVIAGPTGVGKTKVALELAERFDIEVVSVDSRQVYRHMDIGTNKPKKEELCRLKHHLVDIINPDEDYSAGRFIEEALAAIADIEIRSKTPVLVGGTGFYIKALIDGLNLADVPPDPDVRNMIEAIVREEGIESLYSRLLEVDPKAASGIGPNNLPRLTRAYEVYLITGRPFSEKRGVRLAHNLDCRVFCLMMDRAELNRRINARAKTMLEEGFVEEVEAILRMGYSPRLRSLQAIGYREIIAFLKSEMAMDKALEEIKIKTRRFAKRQITWFRHQHQAIEYLPAEDVPGVILSLAAFLEEGTKQKTTKGLTID